VTAAVPVAARQSAPAAVRTVTLREKRTEHNHGSCRANGCLQSDASAPCGPRMPPPLTGRHAIPGSQPFGKTSRLGLRTWHGSGYLVTLWGPSRIRSASAKRDARLNAIINTGNGCDLDHIHCRYLREMDETPHKRENSIALIGRCDQGHIGQLSPSACGLTVLTQQLVFDISRTVHRIRQTAPTEPDRRLPPRTAGERPPG
jgi:hypothetical protein